MAVSKLLRIGIVLSSISALAAAQTYNLVDNYDYTNWLQMMSVQNITDLTGGYVTYVTEATALQNGYINFLGNQVYLGVDYTDVLDPNGPGRNSVRLLSNNAYENGLIIGDFAHMPGSDCGLWPAFWMVGPNWPSGGEVDIIEGVNIGVQNQMTLHTSPGCVVSVGTQGQTGSSVGDPGCGDGGGYNGCAVVDYVGTSYGTAFNSVGGGVYATLWTASSIAMWYWARDDIPADITAGTPNVAGWGTPAADFSGCAFDSYFNNLNIVCFPPSFSSHVFSAISAP
ncbi:MAG: hypothetical protein MMC33_004538 [Icmadophila ericetorum]|nr:hypothetical protein [Icmadophila ericetorum]